MYGQRLKFLLCCYACDPRRGSEPGVGWNFAFHIATYHDVHVLVEKDEFETSIRDFTSRYPDKVKNLTFHFIRRKHHNLLRKIWPPSYYWFYRLWLRRVYEYAQTLHQKEKFDVVHQITLAGFSIQSIFSGRQ